MLNSQLDIEIFQKDKTKGSYKGKNFDISKVKCFNCLKMGHFAKDCRSKKKGNFKGKHQASVATEDEEPRKKTRVSSSDQEKRKEHYLVSALS